MRYNSTQFIFFLLALIVVNTSIIAGTKKISGIVYTKNIQGEKEFLIGVNVTSLNKKNGTITDEIGSFSIEIPDTVKYIVASYIGYSNDTILVFAENKYLNIELKRADNLIGFEKKERLKTTEISLKSVIKTENLGQQELYKAACCNLSQSFETTPSIDVSFTDAVSGYRQIKLLGLASAYTLVTQENMPLIRGLASIAGLGFTAGSWIESIQLSKGTGSVVNGYESLAGQINVELKKPFATDKLYVNLYQSSQGSTEADVNFKIDFNAKLSTVLMVDITSQWMKIDLNSDHFIDQPLGNQFNIANRWIYEAQNGWLFQAGVHILNTHVVGGDWNYKEGAPQVNGNPWGYVATTQRLEDWAKIAKVFTKREETSVGLQLYNIDHHQQSQYGQRTYSGLQNSFYANLIFQTYIHNTKNIIKFGASEVLDIYNETLTNNNTGPQYYNRNENVQGIFGEYSFNYSEKLNMVAGLRGDYNNYFGGFLTPRLHIRYAPLKNLAFRSSLGRAQRTANIFADNIGFLASNRQVDIVNPLPGKPYGLNPEVAWNTGVNMTYKFKYRYHRGVISIDYYYTRFQNQVVVDVNYPQILNFYNLAGKSFANSFQAQFEYDLFRNFDIRLAYRYYQVMTTYGFSAADASLQEKPFVPPSRIFSNFAYHTKNNWKFDYTLQWISEQRTPFAPIGAHNHGTGKGVFENSPSYFQMSAQITKIFNEKFEIYAGGENLADYMQHDAIVDYKAPYSSSFDASMIWGPMMGVNLYVGLRYRIK